VESDVLQLREDRMIANNRLKSIIIFLIFSIVILPTLALISVDFIKNGLSTAFSASSSEKAGETHVIF
jgi:hypothetical protein